MKMISKFAPALILAIALSACGDSPETTEAPKPAVVAKKPEPKKPEGPKAPMTAEQVKQFSVSFEQAMGEIPPELRNDFQKVFECEVKKNNALPPEKQRNIDGNAVREMTAALKANPGIANCA